MGEAERDRGVEKWLPARSAAEASFRPSDLGDRGAISRPRTATNSQQTLEIDSKTASVHPRRFVLSR